MHIDRSVNCEAYILGVILKFGNSALEQTMELVKSEDFMSEYKHRIIFKEVLKMHKNGDPCTFMSLRENTSAETLKRMGGSAYLLGLVDDVVTEANIPQFSKKISEEYRLREIKRTCLDIAGFAERDGADADKILAMAENRLHGIGENVIDKGLRPCTEFLPIVMDRIQDYQSGEIKRRLIFSGITGLDDIVGGFLPGQLVVIGGYTSSGKTSLGIQIAEYVGLIQKKTVGYFSLEMGADELVERSIIGQSRIDGLNYKSKQLSDEHWDSLTKAKNRLALSKCLFSDTSTCSILDIKRQAKRAVMQNELRMVVIDYCSLVDTERMATREQEVAEISRSTKRLARELKIPIFLLVQLSRQHQTRADKTPQLFDLRESGAIEQDADVVLFVHHDKDNSELIVAKQRNGKCGTIPMTFHEGRWVQLARNYAPDEAERAA